MNKKSAKVFLDIIILYQVLLCLLIRPLHLVQHCVVYGYYPSSVGRKPYTVLLASGAENLTWFQTLFLFFTVNGPRLFEISGEARH